MQEGRDFAAWHSLSFHLRNVRRGGGKREKKRDGTVGTRIKGQKCNLTGRGGRSLQNDGNMRVRFLIFLWGGEKP